MELKRVVVTGLGAVTPVGNTPEETWESLVTGKSGAAPITVEIIIDVQAFHLAGEMCLEHQ